MNKAILIGNLAADPETRTTQSGISVCTFRIAVQRRFTNQQGVREADFFNIVAWRGLADLCSKYLAKGRKVAVEGAIQNRSYDAQDGSKRYITEIVAENVEFLSNRQESPEGASAAQASNSSNDEADVAHNGFLDVTDTDDELPF